MKILVATNLLQAAALLVLLVFLLDDNRDVIGSPSPTSVPFAPATKPNTAQPSMDETRLRQIIREELIVVLRNQDEHRMDDAAARQRSPEENRYQREYVSQQIDYYASIGAIGEQEMHELQREIAELDNAGRRAMLSKLTRAMNTQQIKGQM